jgi:hypothetical protein
MQSPRVYIYLIHLPKIKIYGKEGEIAGYGPDIQSDANW